MTVEIYRGQVIGKQLTAIHLITVSPAKAQTHAVVMYPVQKLRLSVGITSREQQFSSLITHQSHPEDLLKHRWLGTTPKASASVGL